MSPQINAKKANINLAVLFCILMGILTISTLRNDIFYKVFAEPVYLVLHTLLEFAGIVASFLVFGVAWHSWKQRKSLRDLFFSATFLAVGIFDLGHTLSYYGMPDLFSPNSPDKAAIFWLCARLSAAVGLLAAALVSNRKQQRVSGANFIPWILICTLAVITLILGNPGLIPRMYIWGEGSTHIKIGLEYCLMILNGLAIFIYGYRNPSQRQTYYLRLALVFCLASEMAITFYTNVFDIYNLIGHVYKIAGYYYIMKALFETAILRPYARMSRLAEMLRELSNRNMDLYKKARENQELMQNAFIQLGSAIASKHDIQAVFTQIVQAAAAVFNCRHVFLGMCDNGSDKLRVVASVSSFSPPEYLELQDCFMGIVFTENQARVIDDLEAYPERVCPAIKLAGLRSMVGTPIIIHNEAIGVLALFSGKEKAYSAGDAVFLAAFAQHAGEAINHAKMYENTMESFKQLSMHYEIVKSIALQTSPSALLQMVTERLYGLLAADGAVSFIMHHRNDGLHTEPVFVHNFLQAEVNHLQRMFSNDNTAWPWVNSADEGANGAQEGKAVTISILMRKRLEILPLQTGGTLQGLIVFSWKNAYAQIPSGLEITLRTVAAQTAIALERAYLNENVKEMALTDALTKLPNRRQFDISLMREMSRTRSFGRPMCLAMLDIDYFKHVNDNYGHLAGDEVLRQLGGLLKKHFRSTDIAARFGGEEFTVIMPETGIDKAAAMTEAFRKDVENTEFDTGDACICITISAGVCIYELECRFNSGNELIDAADSALYKAKQSGRNRVIISEK
jgi:diguanylate cyclase (GGDEF)-like protein